MAPSWRSPGRSLATTSVITTIRCSSVMPVPKDARTAVDRSPVWLSIIGHLGKSFKGDPHCVLYCNCTNLSLRISLLATSMGCAFGTFLLAGYLYQHRRLKVFKVASPIFLLITLIGCTIMYLEMIAIFPYLETSWCIATKWTRHMGFCITYTSLLMKTWRYLEVSLAF